MAVLDLTLDDDDDDNNNNNNNNNQEISEYDVHAGYSGADRRALDSQQSATASRIDADDEDSELDVEFQIAMHSSLRPTPPVQQTEMSQQSQRSQQNSSFRQHHSQPVSRDETSNALADIGRSLWSSVFEPTPPPPTLSAAPAAKRTTTSSSSQSTAAATAEDKAAKKAAIAAAKADAKAEAAAKRAADKAAKAAQKKKSRSDMLAEMVLCVDTRLVEQADGAVILSELQSNGVACRVRELPIAGAISWLRAVDGGAEERREPNVAVRMLGEDFIAHCRRRTMEQVVRDAKRHYGADVQLVVIIEGLDKAVTRDEQTRTRIMAANVRLLTAGSAPQPAEPAFDRMGQFVELEMSGVVVHEARTAAASAEYVVSFTRVLSERPYRLKSAFGGFCAEALTARQSGLSGLSVWAKQLAQVQGVSPIIAQAIEARFPTFKSLVIDCYMSPVRSEVEKSQLLAGLMVQRVTPTGTTSRAIGTALSARIFRVFCETDAHAQLQ